MNKTTPRGFTLVELMITVLVSAIVMMGVFSIYNVSMRGYRVQDQAIQALAQMRAAGQQLRFDMRSAAFQAPANSDAELWVNAYGTTALTAVAIDSDPGPPDPPVHLSETNQNIAPQRIRLLGDYAGQGKTWKTSRIVGNEVFIWWLPEHGGKVEFERIFDPNHILRLDWKEKTWEQYYVISSATWAGVGANSKVTLTQPVQGTMGMEDGHEVSIASFYNYRLQRDTRRNNESSKYDLIREELDPAGNPIAGTWLVVAEYVVDLQVYDLCFNQTNPDPQTMTQIPINLICFPNLAAAQTGGFDLSPTGQNDTHLLRSLTVKLAARTPFEDEDVPFMERSTVNEPLRAFELDTTVFGAARVFETAFTVFMTSIQARRCD